MSFLSPRSLSKILSRIRAHLRNTRAFSFDDDDDDDDEKKKKKKKKNVYRVSENTSTTFF